MKTIAIAFVALCTAVTSATAQTNPPISTRTINLTAEQYHVRVLLLWGADEAS